jgi:hypothetical protein
MSAAYGVGGGGQPNADIGWHGGVGVRDGPKLADIIYEQEQYTEDLKVI